MQVRSIKYSTSPLRLQKRMHLPLVLPAHCLSSLRRRGVVLPRKNGRWLQQIINSLSFRISLTPLILKHRFRHGHSMEQIAEPNRVEYSTRYIFVLTEYKNMSFETFTSINQNSENKLKFIIYTYTSLSDIKPKISH